MRSLLRRLLVIFPLLILFVLLTGDTTEASAQQLRDTFRRVKQSVVVVRTREKTVAPLLRQGLTSSDGLASGVLITDDGKVLTAAHVVQAVDKVFVEFADGYLVTARVISSAPNADVALLQLDSVPKGVAPARLGDSDQVEVGDEVFVGGAPYGLALTLTVGHVSGRSGLPKNRRVGDWGSGPAHDAPQLRGTTCCWAATSSSRSMGLRSSKVTRPWTVSMRA
jgi:S1-C subfamily serine protease